MELTSKDDYIVKDHEDEGVDDRRVYKSNLVELDVLKELETLGLPTRDIWTLQLLKYLKDISTKLDTVTTKLDEIATNTKG